EFGQFRGTISVYGDEYRDHVIPWKGGGGRPTECGPFTVNIANVQGASRESTIPLEDYGRLIYKMNRFGGLYIYKDGLRILPYGDTDYDWLEIEKRRTKGAAYYFFSYRRIFGVIEVNHKDNPILKEKAGREGFLENQAYRQLKSILKNFFIQLATDFFREESTYGARYLEKKTEMERNKAALDKRERMVSSKRKQLSDNLVEFFQRYDAGKPQEEALALTEDISTKLKYASQIDDPKAAAAAFLDIESSARRRLSDLQNRYRLARPRGVGLSKALQREWGDYLDAFEKLQETVFDPTNALVEAEVSVEAQKARLELDRRIRIENALNDLSAEARKTAKAERDQTLTSMDKVYKEVRVATRDSLAEVEGVLKDVFAEFARLDVSEMEDAKLVEARNALETRITQAKDKEQQFLQYVRAQLEVIDFSDNLAQLDQMEALEQRSLALEEQADMDLQLTQLGMAIGVINHEFNSSIGMIRDSLPRLGAWADLNPDLQGLFKNLRAGFEHLDGYLTLFTPLDRRLRRSKVEIRGSDIKKFLQDLFAERRLKDNVIIQASEAFVQKSVTEYPSSLYPVFVNLVDNALFWLKDQPEPRIVKLDADDRGFIVSDNGPGIPERDREVIFEMGFSRKPGGRGMGLHISREVLKKIGYTLTLDVHYSGRGATFRIEPGVKQSGE
ncbi:MAG: ATP-binding protein, partial [Patescibacteria group bacterium]